MFHIVALLFAVVMGVGAIWLYRGNSERSRFWYGQDGFIDERMVSLFFPSLSLFFLFAGLTQLWSLILPKGSIILTILTYGSGTLAVISLIGLVWGLLPLPYPQQVRPPWIRQLEEFEAKKLAARDQARRKRKNKSGANAGTQAGSKTKPKYGVRSGDKPKTGTAADNPNSDSGTDKGSDQGSDKETSKSDQADKSNRSQ